MGNTGLWLAVPVSVSVSELLTTIVAYTNKNMRI